MSTYYLKRVQRLPVTLQEAWQFFSAPGNLPTITPDYMRFQVLSDSGSSEMYPGQIITYFIKPVLGIKLFWMTEITHVQDGRYFIDEQRMGPYAFWHHTHIFREIPGGVEMTDQVHYKLPFGVLGRLAHALFVKRQLHGIFNYRTQVLEERYGKFAGPLV
ncbi:MAG TPA: SRPBCC family protein [Adhaeribacter sp.]|nr:SRPBCC family protein [Adhaeribacter sp.]